MDGGFRGSEGDGQMPPVTAAGPQDGALATAEHRAGPRWVAPLIRTGVVLALGSALLGGLYLWQRWGALVALDGVVSFCF